MRSEAYDWVNRQRRSRLEIVPQLRRAARHPYPVILNEAKRSEGALTSTVGGGAERAGRSPVPNEQKIRSACPATALPAFESLNDSAPKPTDEPMKSKISPCLWFDDQAEDAVRFYTGIFKDSKINAISRYPDAGQEIHGRPAGSVMVVDFELNGQPFTALNGGPHFKFNEAISFQIECATQEEVDYYWEKLGEGGDPNAQQCGWLKDKFGLSWQVVPTGMVEMLNDPDPAKSRRAFAAMLQMKKLDLASLRRAFKG